VITFFSLRQRTLHLSKRMERRRNEHRAEPSRRTPETSGAAATTTTTTTTWTKTAAALRRFSIVPARKRIETVRRFFGRCCRTWTCGCGRPRHRRRRRLDDSSGGVWCGSWLVAGPLDDRRMKNANTHLNQHGYRSITTSRSAERVLSTPPTRGSPFVNESPWAVCRRLDLCLARACLPRSGPAPF
jgi:hypothetical protein